MRRYKGGFKHLFLRILIILIVVGAGGYLFFNHFKKAQAEWFDTNWFYRKAITAANNSPYTATDIPYKYVLDTATLITAGKMQATGNDIRITDSKGKVVRSQVEQSTLNTTTTGIWFEATAAASSSATYYVYYGNPSAPVLGFKSDVRTVTGSGAEVEMLDGYGYSTSTSYAKLSDMRKNGTNLGVDGCYHESDGYPSWWDDRAFTRTLLASGPLFVEVKLEDTSYGAYSSFGNIVKMFDNGYVSERIYMNYNTNGTEDHYYYLPFNTGTRNSVWVNASGVLVDQAPNSGNLYEADLRDNWFGQRWTTSGNYGGTIITKNGSDWYYGGTSAQDSYYQTNYSYSTAYTNGSSRQVNYGTFAGSGSLDEMHQKGSLYGAYSTTGGTEEKSPAPVAYWKFDEGTGTTVYDDSSNNNDGTISGATWQAEDMCVTGKCLKFDGSGDYVNFGTSTSLAITDTLSLSFWIKPLSFSATQYFVDKHNAGANGYFGRIGTDGSVYFRFGDNIVQTSAGALTINQWQYVSIVGNATSEKIYINGAEVKTQTGSYTWSSTDDAFIFGNTSANEGAINGFVDDLKVFNYARTADQVKADYNAGKSGAGGSAKSASMGNKTQDWMSNGLVGYWKMDETTGNAADSSGNGITLTNNNSTSYAAGKFGNAGSFAAASSQYLNGSDTSVSTSSVSTSTVSTPTAYSFQRKTWYDGTRYWQALNANSQIEFWYSADGLTWTENTTARLSYNTYDFSVYADSSRLYIVYYTGGLARDFSVRAATSYPGTSFGWGSATIVYDGSSSTIYNYVSICRDSAGYIWISSKYYAVAPDIPYLYIKRSTNPDDVTAWNSPTTLESAYGTYYLGNCVSLGSGKIYALWKVDSGAIKGKYYDGSTWDSSATSIATGTSGLTTNMSAVSDTSGNIHLVYTDSSGYVKYQKYTTSWQSAVTLDGNAGNAYSSISIDIANNALYAFWIRSNTIYYKKGVSDYASGNWETNPTSFYSTGTNVYLTSGYSDFGSGKNVFLGWTNGSGSPYSVMWGSIASKVKTVSFWINPSATTDEFINFTSSAYVSASSGVVSGTNFINPKVYVNGALNGAVAAGTWNHVVITSDSAVSANQFEVGKGNGGYTNGSVDEVRIYNRALSSQEVRQLADWAPGPVGYWKMDDKVSGNSKTIIDSSVNGNNGATNYGANAAGMNCAISGKYGGACQFDGVDDYIDAGDPASLRITGGITLEGWVKINPNLSAPQVLFGKGHPFGDDLDYGYSVTWYNVSKQIYFDTYSTSLRDALTGSAVAITDNNWHYITATWDGTTNTNGKKIYIDGVLKLQGTSTISLMGTPSYNFFIGKDGNASRYYPQGLFDDVKVYSYARTQKQILEDMNAGHPAVGSPVGSYVGYWKFDEGQGSTAYDQSVNDNDGTITNASWINNGKFGKALSFDAAGEHVRKASTIFDKTDGQEITVSAWIKPNWTSGYGDIVVNRTASLYNWMLYQHTTDGSVQFHGAAQNKSTYIPPNNTWTHIVATVDSGGNYNLYANGVLKQTVTGYQYYASAPGTLSIADYGSNSEPWNGAIDELKIYPFALTADDIKAEYNQGKSIVMGSLSNTSGLSGGSIASNSASAEFCIPGDTATCNPPVGQWKMDDHTGDSATDTSGNNNNGALGGGTAGYKPTWQSSSNCHSGSCLKFDGSDDHVQVTQGSNLLPVNFTASMWVYPTSWTHMTHTALLTSRSTSNNGLMFFILSQGNLNFDWGDGASSNRWDTGYQPPINTWTHLTITRDSSGRYLYVNGRLQNSTGTAGGNPTANTYFRIGADTYSDQYFYKGQIDDVRVFNYARTPAQIAWDYNRGKPVGYWKFDECQGSVANDFSGNGNTGTITIGATVPQDGIGTCTDGDTGNAWYNGRTGKFNSAMSFDGVDDYVSKTSADLKYTNEITLEAWVNLDDKTTRQEPVAAWTTAYDQNSVRPYVESNYMKLWVYSGGAVQTSPLQASISKWNTGEWHNVTITVKTNEAKIYLDGILSATDTSVTMPTALTNVKIGSDVGGWYWNGLVDDVKIYNYALTAEQIKLDYNQGAAVRFGPNAGRP